MIDQLRVFMGIRPPISAPPRGEVRLLPTGMMPRPNLVNIGGSAAPNVAGMNVAAKGMPR